MLQEGDFAPGLAFAATVLADVAVEAGELDEAQALLGLLPQEGWPAGVGTVLIPAARGRLRLAQGRPAEALADFQTCAAMFSAEVWGTEMRDVGYLHARAGAAQALLRLGEREQRASWPRPSWPTSGVRGAARARGRVARRRPRRGRQAWARAARESVASLRARRRCSSERIRWPSSGRRCAAPASAPAAREPLAEALELAARCGARPLAARAREELKATGARPRRAWRTGVEALTPSELRVVRLAADGRSNREIAHELYVTLKTVEGHLSRAYRKLGIEAATSSPASSRGKDKGANPLANDHLASESSVAPATQGGFHDHHRTRGVRAGTDTFNAHESRGSPRCSPMTSFPGARRMRGEGRRPA